MTDYSLLINYITGKIPHRNKKDLASKISKILKINEKTSYNKLSGISQFKTLEIIEIARNFRISLDDFTYQEVGVQRPFPFLARGYHYKPRTFNEYLENLIVHFEPLMPYRKVALTSYLSRELPIFHFLYFPQIFYMKMWFWNCNNWQIKSQEEYRPSIWLDTPQSQDLRHKMIDFFSALNETEIWGPHLLSTTMSQFEFLLKHNILTDTETIKKIKSEFGELMDYIDKMILTGKKTNVRNEEIADLSIHLNLSAISSDMINIRVGEKMINYIMVNTPNFLESRNEEFCQSMLNYEHSIKEQSYLLTGSSKFIRDEYCAKWKTDLNDFLNRIEK